MNNFLKILMSILIVGIFANVVLLFNLNVGDEPKTSDVIIVAAGTPDRDFKAIELFWQGYSESDNIIVSPLVEHVRAIYLAHGVSSNNLINDPYATSTYTNARNTLKLMDNLGYDSAIIVTADFHTLRTKMIYERQNRHYNFDLTYVASYQQVDGEEVNWYEITSRRRWGYKEIYKFWGYLFGLYHIVDL